MTKRTFTLGVDFGLFVYMGLIAFILFIVINILPSKNKSVLFCIYKFMYTKVYNTVLAYPTSQDQMSCDVYNYTQKNKENKK